MNRWFNWLGYLITILTIGACSKACIIDNDSVDSAPTTTADRKFSGVGPVTPGSYTTVTATASDAGGPIRYSSLQCPSPTMPVASSDLCIMDLAILNVQERAIDGVEGGTYTPSNKIQFEGDAGVYFDYAPLYLSSHNTTTVNSTVNVGDVGHVTSSDLANWTGTYRFGNSTATEIRVGDAGVVNINGGSLGINAGASVNSISGAAWTGVYTFGDTSNVVHDVSSDLTLKGHVTSTSDANYTGTFTFDSSSTVTHAAGSTLTLAGQAAFSGAGNVAWRLINAVDADHTYGINDGDEFYCKVTADRTYTVTTTGARVGNRIRFSVVDASGVYGVTIVYPTLGGTSSRTLKYTTGSRTWIDLVYDGTYWRVSAEAFF